MFAKERQEKIVSLVNEKGSIKVKELAVQFEVTEDSIRKDLTILERKGLLQKTYGGAIKVRTITHNFGVDTRRLLNSDEKKEIARKAFSLIEEGDTIFLDVSTIAIEIANLIVEHKSRITVMSNMLDVLNVLIKSNTIDVLFIGGSLNRTRDAFIGTHAIQQIEKFQFDKAFLGCVGVDVDEDKVYTYKIDDGYTKEAILKATKNPYLVLERDKFLHDGTYCYCTLQDCKGVITSSKVDLEIVHKIHELEVNIIK